MKNKFILSLIVILCFSCASLRKHQINKCIYEDLSCFRYFHDFVKKNMKVANLLQQIEYSRTNDTIFILDIEINPLSYPSPSLYVVWNHNDTAVIRTGFVKFPKKKHLFDKNINNYFEERLEVTKAFRSQDYQGYEFYKFALDNKYISNYIIELTSEWKTTQLIDEGERCLFIPISLIYATRLIFSNKWYSVETVRFQHFFSPSRDRVLYRNYY